MATNKNFEVKNGLTIAGTERISSAGAFSGSLASATTATTQSATDNSTKIATTAYTDAAITSVIGGAPGTLDTLNELAAAINDDASYASTLTTALATKAPLASPTLTGTPKINVGTNKNIIFSGGIGEIGSVPGFQGINDAGSANTDIGMRGTTIRFATGSSERMRINSSGYVGIGTTNSPNAPLEVSGGVGMSGGWGRSMVLRHNFPTLVFQSEYSTDAYAAIAYDNTTGMHFMVNSPNIDVFSSSQTAALYIRDDKRIGVGTTSVDGGKVVISGEGGSSSATLNLATATSTTFNHAINAFNSNLTDGENNLIVFGKEGSTKNAAWIGYKWRSAGSDTNQLTFGHWGNNNVFNILGNGNVGIGIEAPVAPFVIQVPASAVNAEMRFQSGAYTSDHFKAYANQSGRFYIQAVSNTSHGVYLQYNGTSWASASDERLKENIVELENVLPKITNLRAVKYNFTADEENTTAIGFIAQDWQTDFSEVVSDSIPEELGMKYTETIPVLLKAIQELKIELDAAKSRITTLEG